MSSPYMSTASSGYSYDLDFWGAGAWPFISEYGGMLGADGPTYIRIEWEHEKASWLQNYGFQPTTNSNAEPIYLLELHFITAFNRSADAYNSTYQVIDSFTLEISAALPDVTDPADCIYASTGLNITFEGH
jgi:hypothetical protein